MQNAECRVPEGASFGYRIPASSFCTLHSAFCISPLRQRHAVPPASVRRGPSCPTVIRRHDCQAVGGGRQSSGRVFAGWFACDIASRSVGRDSRNALRVRRRGDHRSIAAAESPAPRIGRTAQPARSVEHKLPRFGQRLDAKRPVASPRHADQQRYSPTSRAIFHVQLRERRTRRPIVVVAPFIRRQQRPHALPAHALSRHHGNRMRPTIAKPHERRAQPATARIKGVQNYGAVFSHGMGELNRISRSASAECQHQFPSAFRFLTSSFFTLHSAPCTLHSSLFIPHAAPSCSTGRGPC